MSKTLKKSIAIVMTLGILLGLIAIPGVVSPAVAEPEPPVSLSEFSGRLDVWNNVVRGEWNRVPHISTADGTGEDQLTLRATVGGDVLYTIVEGNYRDTRNVYFISLSGRSGGFTFHGRPNVHFVVANGFIYRTTATRALPAIPAMAARPEFTDEFFHGFAERLDRVSMEYHTHWTGMRLRLDQLTDANGNIPDPWDINVSWQGWDTGAITRANVRRHLPANGTSFMSVGQFERLREEGVYYPQEDFSLILNPLMGGGPGSSAGNRNNGQVMGYVYVSWRDMSPAPGVIDLDNTRVTVFGDYAVAGPGRDEWGARGAYLNTIFANAANLGHYMSLRLHMDLPQGGQGRSVAVPANYVWQGQQVFPDPVQADLAPAAQRQAFLNLLNRRVADVPTWVIQDMRWQSNTPYQEDGSPADCPHNVPFEADRPHLVWCDTANDYVDDGLYARMRDSSDPHYLFFQAFRDQQLYVATSPNGLSAPQTPAQQQGITDGFFRCAIPNPSRGALVNDRGEPIPLDDLRVCPNGCVPYRRPDFNAEGVFVSGNRGLNQARLGWSQDNNWGPEGVWYFSPNDISGMVGLGPRYEHHMLATHHEDLVRALAERIGDPTSDWRSVAQIQLGSLGHWGEWHNWPIEDKDSFPNAEFAYEIVRHYIDAFAGFDNIQIAMRYANWIATRYDLGIFHDQAAQNAHFTVWNSLAGQNLAADNWAPNGWGRGNRTQGVNLPTGAPNNTSFLHNNINANMRNVPAFTGLAGDSWYNSGSGPNMAVIDEYANAARNPTFWMRGGWSGGEWGDNSSGSWHHNLPALTNVGGTWTPNEFGGDWDNTMINIMRTIYAFRWANTSNLLPRGPGGVHTAQQTTAANTRLQKNNLAAHDNMGYRFVLEEVAVDMQGATVDVDMVVNNRGVAPFYRDWPFEVSFIDENGDVVYTTIIDDVNISDWMPRHRAINNARPAPAAYRYVENALGETQRVYYRTADQIRSLPVHPVGSPYFIPANDGRSDVSFSFTIPADLPAGDHTLAIAILDPVLGNDEPTIQFANVGTRNDLRLPIGPFVVQAPLAINFNANGGTGTMQAVTVQPGDSFTIPANTFTRSGHEFTGWNTAANGSGTAFAPEATILDVQVDTTLFAQWIPVAVIQRTITFNANGGTGTMPNGVVADGTDFQIPANAFTRSGYEFAGWNTAANGTGTAFTAGAIISNVTADMTLFAQWSAELVAPGEWLPAESTNPFIDVPNDNWQNEPVSWAIRNGIAAGVANTNPPEFRPNAPLTREVFATFLHRVVGEPQAPRTSFADNASISPWAVDAVRWGVEAGVILGFADNTFRPQVIIPREQIATMLFRFAEYLEKDTQFDTRIINTFPDSGEINSWAIEAMQWATYNELITGIARPGGPRLEPQGSATRAQAVAVIYRFVMEFEVPPPPAE